MLVKYTQIIIFLSFSKTLYCKSFMWHLHCLTLKSFKIKRKLLKFIFLILNDLHYKPFMWHFNGVQEQIVWNKNVNSKIFFFFTLNVFALKTVFSPLECWQKNYKLKNVRTTTFNILWLLFWLWKLKEPI